MPQEFGNHNGGNLEFGPNGHLWIGLGDGGGAGVPLNRAQDLDTLLGKMLRLCVSGSVPGRSEVFVRIVDPKPERVSLAEPDQVLHLDRRALDRAALDRPQVNSYRLECARPGSDELSGLFDRTGSLP